MVYSLGKINTNHVCPKTKSILAIQISSGKTIRISPGYHVRTMDHLITADDTEETELDLDCRTALSATRKRKGHESDRATLAEDFREVRCGHADQRAPADDFGSQVRAVQSLGFLYSRGYDRRSCHHPSHALLLLETMPTIEGRNIPDADRATRPSGDQPYSGTRTKTQSLSLTITIVLYIYFILVNRVSVRLFLSTGEIYNNE